MFKVDEDGNVMVERSNRNYVGYFNFVFIGWMVGSFLFLILIGDGLFGYV